VYDLKIFSFLQMAILYNLVAFATQFLVGIFVDKYKNPKQVVIFGLLLSISAICTFFINPVLSIVLIGLSNSFIHIGGGVISIKTTPGKATAPGLFVAPGALGLTLGILYGKGNQFPIWPLIISVLLTIWLINKYVAVPKIKLIKIVSIPKNYIFVAVGLLLFTISSRSIVGLSLDLPWKNTNLLIIMTATVIVLGKGLGGIVADKVGWVKTGIIALLVSAPLITIGSSMFLPSIIGIFVFQFSMPITLAAIARLLPGREGLAFGLTTFVLVFAALAVTPLNIFTTTVTFTFLLILASAGTLYVGLELSKNK
jgi:FSR family fosmidomycin resistance protein-like MFS transporter